MTVAEPLASPRSRIAAGLLAGLAVEVSNLDTARAFYDRILAGRGGRWQREGGTLTYRLGSQHLDLVRRGSPRTFSDGGHHCAIPIEPDRLGPLVEELSTAGHAVDWWREDHPSERSVGPYVLDPSGNRVQLIASANTDLLIDHAAIEIHHFDYCEYVYVNALGGQVDYYHGWRSADLQEAKRWAAGDDPCAPWTRRDNPHYRDFLVADPATGQLRPSRHSVQSGGAEGRLRVPRPNGQLFIAYGPTRIVLVSATKVRQQPPEELIQGTPRLILAARQAADVVAAGLDATPIAHERQGDSVYLRDPDGNFAEVLCSRG